MYELRFLFIILIYFYLSATAEPLEGDFNDSFIPVADSSEGLLEMLYPDE
jgi:hypothetical protein